MLGYELLEMELRDELRASLTECVRALRRGEQVNAEWWYSYALGMQAAADFARIRTRCKSSINRLADHCDL